jgi:hypothetical protein
MALTGGTFGDGAASGTTKANLTTIIGSARQEYRQLDVRADTSNAGVIYIGLTGVSATAAFVQLAAGESWGINPQAFTAPAGGDFKIQPDDIYIVGTDVADQAFVAALQ